MRLWDRWIARFDARDQNRLRGRFSSAGRTHRGTRRYNQDRLLDRPDISLWAVADGMGGHHDGAGAAQCVVDALAAAESESGAELEAALEFANLAIRERDPGHVSGSTIVALRIADDGFDCRWAGDSELWLLRNGELRKLTRDHSVVDDLIRVGNISEHERASHPRRNVITRAIGVSESVEIDRTAGGVWIGDLFILCSDGLSKALPSEAWLPILLRKDIDEAADELINRAVSAGARDNVTLLLVRVES